MKLAEALAERKAIKTRMEDLKKRIYQNAQVQEGDPVPEEPLALIEELKRETAAFAALVGRINRTNMNVTLADGLSLSDAILKKDMLQYLHMLHVNLADKANPTRDRYSTREIKMVATVNIGEIRKQADEIAREYRLLDMRIQETNWKTDLA